MINSFSKYFSMTGWRVGWMVLPEDLVRPVECLAQNLFISAPHIAQVAAEAAFDCTDELDANVARYRRSRDTCCARCPAPASPDLARRRAPSTCTPTCRDRTNDSAAFCARMLAEAGVAAAPASTSTAPAGTDFVRFSYCGPEADMAEAARRLARWRD